MVEVTIVWARCIVFYPSIDGVDILAAPWKLAQAGKTAPNVPILVGSNREDAVTSHISLPSCGQSCSEYNFQAWLKSMLSSGTMGVGHPSPLQILEAVALYSDEPEVDPHGPYSAYSKWYWAAKHVLSDLFKTCSARRAARWFSGVAGSYLYWFTHVPSAQWGSGMGCYHSAEIQFVFGNPSPLSPKGLTKAEGQLSAAMMHFWATFAAHGHPSSYLGITWPSYTNGTDTLLELDIAPGSGGDGMAPRNKTRSDFCDFWDRLLFTDDSSDFNMAGTDLAPIMV